MLARCTKLVPCVTAKVTRYAQAPRGRVILHDVARLVVVRDSAHIGYAGTTRASRIKNETTDEDRLVTSVALRGLPTTLVANEVAARKAVRQAQVDYDQRRRAVRAFAATRGGHGRHDDQSHDESGEKDGGKGGKKLQGHGDHAQHDRRHGWGDTKGANVSDEVVGKHSISGTSASNQAQLQNVSSMSVAQNAVLDAKGEAGRGDDGGSVTLAKAALRLATQQLRTATTMWHDALAHLPNVVFGKKEIAEHLQAPDVALWAWHDPPAAHVAKATIAERLAPADADLRILSVRKGPATTMGAAAVVADASQASTVQDKASSEKDTKGDVKVVIEHDAIIERLGIVEAEQGRRVAGTRFVYLRGDGARLFRAFTQLAQDIAADAQHEPVVVPYMVRREYVAGTGFAPLGESRHTYSVAAEEPMNPASQPESQGATSEASHVLIGTSEIPLAALYAGRRSNKLERSRLPVLLSSFSPCFRREAGAAGRQSRGLFRMHQFHKVELFALAAPEESMDALCHMVNIQKRIFDALDLTYRICVMPPSDLGHPAAYKIDIEAWMPATGRWGEVSSTSNCTDFQAKRLDISYRLSRHERAAMEERSLTHQEKRVRDELGQRRGAEHEDTVKGKRAVKQSKRRQIPKRGHVHTVNGTCLAIERTMAIFLETHQETDPQGKLRVNLPQALHPYMQGQRVLIEPT